MEPIPWVHDVCRHNLNQQSAAFEARGGLALPPVEVLQLAAGSQPDSELTFTAYDM